MRETCQLHSPGAYLGRLRQLVSEFLFLCKGQPLHFEGQPSHPKNCNLKSAWGQGGTSNRSFFGWGNLGRIFWAPSESRGSSTAEIVQWGASGGRPWVERSGEGFHGANFSPLGNGESRRRGQPGSRWPRTRAKNASFRLRGLGWRRAAMPSPLSGRVRIARFPGLGEGPERERERRPKATRGGGGMQTRHIDSGWELRARTFGKSTGASSGAAPPPPPARLPFRMVTQPAGYAEVCAETRNLPGRRGRPCRLPAPAQPRAPPSPAPGVAEAART